MFLSFKIWTFIVLAAIAKETDLLQELMSSNLTDDTFEQIADLGDMYGQFIPDVSFFQYKCKIHIQYPIQLVFLAFYSHWTW